MERFTPTPTFAGGDPVNGRDPTGQVSGAGVEETIEVSAEELDAFIARLELQLAISGASSALSRTGGRWLLRAGGRVFVIVGVSVFTGWQINRLLHAFALLIEARADQYVSEANVRIVQQQNETRRKRPAQAQAQPARAPNPAPAPPTTDDEDDSDVYVVRGGVVTAEQLQNGVSEHASVPGLTGFSVQSERGRSIQELAGGRSIQKQTDQCYDRGHLA